MYGTYADAGHCNNARKTGRANLQAPLFGEVVEEVATRRILHGNGQVIFCQEHFMELDHMWMAEAAVSHNFPFCTPRFSCQVQRIPQTVIKCNQCFMHNMATSHDTCAENILDIVCSSANLQESYNDLDPHQLPRPQAKLLREDHDDETTGWQVSFRLSRCLTAACSQRSVSPVALRSSKVAYFTLTDHVSHPV